MSQKSDLNAYGVSYEQALTYIGEWETVSYSDLGTTEVYLIEKDGKQLVVIVSATERAVALPSDVFALSR